jgi:Asp-tRNA(Asn)/Glu-tRNA(Gln) amidotransferase A subunit family amidase
MLNIAEYELLDAVSLAEGIRNRQFTAVEALNCAIEKAQLLNPTLNAIIIETFDRAMAQAQAVDQNPALACPGNLVGVPFLIKDIASIKGLPQTNASQLFVGEVATRNANIVDRFLDSGLLLMGKTNTPEFCLTLTTESKLNGPCLNPWNLEHSVGGSSGGAAAAVAAGIVPAAHATDGGGSIRVPAACCGLVGLKPSRGLSVIEDDFGASWSGMSVGHVVSRTVRDSAAFLDVLKLNRPNLYALPTQPDSYLAALGTEPGKLSVAVQNCHPTGAELDPECLSGVSKAAELCHQLGAEVTEATPPIDYKNLASAMAVIISIHIAQKVVPQLEKLNLNWEDCRVEASTKNMAMHGADASASDYLSAMNTLKDIERQMAVFHQQFDVVLSPVLAKEPAKIGWLDMNSDDMGEYIDRFRSYSGFAPLYNGTGQPSISLPLHRTQNKLPIGVMFSAAWGTDSLLLHLARQLEQLDPWPKLAPAPGS